MSVEATTGNGRAENGLIQNSKGIDWRRNEMTSNGKE